MSSQQQEREKDVQSTNPHGLREMVEEQYKKIRENAETYPYVWASYIVVYGGFALWTTYRWRKLRKTEDRVRALQERLRKLVDSQDSATSSTLEKAPPSIDKSKCPK
ncbi:hypothetical protein P3X46_028815 [Hevea brasiliensis]|uniref:Transmembrane protein n=1 Tax=Hevea brasiliensis TaxID=3981 RepID=A0ABQ9KS41_HEVBR|nr:uncharacterized protein LOC110634410 [Hevea brasiliensis]XP_021639087.1 uncharacterized protein LOC110634410 [Hevea brasiliensis]XP_057994134.1 uncharacterized protein LOC110634410 [Hevea brasiliensis]KAJ9146569.1 hypothetical protein P3X46_028815 [Hevea brasiliensis]